MTAIAEAAVSAAPDVLNEAADSASPRVPNLASDPGFKPIADQSLEHERVVERRQAGWLAKHK